jgi:hypothetical protein
MRFDDLTGTKHEGDKMQTARERKQQIKEQRKKSTFSQFCKFLFYFMCLFSIYVLVKKLLQKLGIIETPVQVTAETKTPVNVEMKENKHD